MWFTCVHGVWPAGLCNDCPGPALRPWRLAPPSIDGLVLAASSTALLRHTQTTSTLAQLSAALLDRNALDSAAADALDRAMCAPPP
jgi:hypothetical protein